MALIKCPDCGHDVSEQATSCPTCGRPSAPRSAHGTDRPKRANKGSTWAVIAAISLAVLVGMALSSSRTTSATPPSTDTAASEYLHPRTIEQNLALADRGTQASQQDAAAYDPPLDTLGFRCTQPRQLIGDMATRAKVVLKEQKGRDVSTLELLKGMVASTRDGSKPTDCSQTLAAMMVLY